MSILVTKTSSCCFKILQLSRNILKVNFLFSRFFVSSNRINAFKIKKFRAVSCLWPHNFFCWPLRQSRFFTLSSFLFRRVSHFVLKKRHAIRLGWKQSQLQTNIEKIPIGWLLLRRCRRDCGDDCSSRDARTKET